MKNLSTKFKALIGLSILTAMLGGCDNSTEKTNVTFENKIEVYTTYVNKTAALWIDPETKCEYIGGNMNAAMTPRLDRHGEPICR